LKEEAREERDDDEEEENEEKKDFVGRLSFNFSKTTYLERTCTKAFERSSKKVAAAREGGVDEVAEPKISSELNLFSKPCSSRNGLSLYRTK
jgi:hypothetical protein